MEIVLSSIYDETLEKEKQMLLEEDKNCAYNMLMLNFIITIPIIPLNEGNYIFYSVYSIRPEDLTDLSIGYEIAYEKNNNSLIYKEDKF